MRFSRVGDQERTGSAASAKVATGLKPRLYLQKQSLQKRNRKRQYGRKRRRSKKLRLRGKKRKKEKMGYSKRLTSLRETSTSASRLGQRKKLPLVSQRKKSEARRILLKRGRRRKRFSTILCSLMLEEGYHRREVLGEFRLKRER